MITVYENKAIFVVTDKSIEPIKIYFIGGRWHYFYACPGCGQEIVMTRPSTETPVCALCRKEGKG